MLLIFFFQFEAHKPLLHLVSNMVKLGSLYDNADNSNFSAQVARERMEFQRRVQERRATSVDRSSSAAPSSSAPNSATWDDRSPDHKELEVS